MKNKIKNIKILFTKDISRKQLHIVRKSLDIIATEAKLKKRFTIYSFGLPQNSTHAHLSKTTITEKTLINLEGQRGSSQIDADGLFGKLAYMALSKVIYNKYYFLLITSKYDLKSRLSNFLIGAALPNFGAIISLKRIIGRQLNLKEIPEGMTLPEFENEIIITEVLHELGHVFGCAKTERKYTMDSLGSHDNPRYIKNCVMIQGLKVPEDWIDMTRKRIQRKHPYCKYCLKELKNHFSNTAKADPSLRSE